MFQLIVTVYIDDGALIDLCKRLNYDVSDYEEDGDCTSDPCHDIVPGAPYCPQCGSPVDYDMVEVEDHVDVVMSLFEHDGVDYEEMGEPFVDNEDGRRLIFTWRPDVDTDFQAMGADVTSMGNDYTITWMDGDSVCVENQLAEVNEAAKQIRAKIRSLKKSKFYQHLIDMGDVSLAIGQVQYTR